MLKRIKWKAVLILLTWVISLGGLVVLMSFIEIKKGSLVCRDIKVLIPGIESFIDRHEIDLIIQQKEGKLVGQRMSSIDIHGLENAIKANPYIEDAKVYADMDGTVNVLVRQREPLLRIINYVNQDYFIDRKGIKIPTSANFTPNLLVANGFIMESFSGKVDTAHTRIASALYKTALYIENDTLWKEQIEQLYVNEHQDIEMIPRVGNHRILLGNADSLDIKFRNLLVFYKNAIPRVGWEAYKTINIKYTNQIVCEKNIIDSTRLKSTVVIKAADTIETLQDTLKTATH